MAKAPTTTSVATVPSNVYTNMIQEAERYKGQCEASNEDMTEFLKSVKDLGIHMATFKLALRLRKMDDRELGDWLYGFDMARAYLKLDGATTQDMFRPVPAAPPPQVVVPAHKPQNALEDILAAG
jgi:uncharacterized protein (UPF0335 family)